MCLSLLGCETYMDIVIVLDGSNSIYPWTEVQAFLINILQKFYIGPGQIQVSYGKCVALANLVGLPVMPQFSWFNSRSGVPKDDVV